MKASSISIFCLMKMLNKRMICINVLVQLLVACLAICLSRITTRRYASRRHSDIADTRRV